MQENKLKLIRLLIKHECLQFGDFTTKSGKKTPFFVNMGQLGSGSALEFIATEIVKLLETQFSPPLQLYGPAYKGIPIAAAVALKWSAKTNQDIFFSFNRKEAKSHGEKGIFIGHAPTKKMHTIITEDVLTAATSVRESLELVKNSNLDVQAVAVILDRQERIKFPEYDKPILASEYLKKHFKLKFLSLVSASELLTALKQHEEFKDAITTEQLTRLENYISANQEG